MEQYGRSVGIGLSLSPSVCCCRIVYISTVQGERCVLDFGMINIQSVNVLPAAVPLFSCHCSRQFPLLLFLFLVFLCPTLFLNSFPLTPPLSVPRLSLQHVPPFLFLCLYTPPHLLLLLPSFFSPSLLAAVPK